MNRFSFVLLAIAVFLGLSQPSFAYLPPNSGAAAGSGDYLNVIAAEGAFVWSSERLPLTVYISDGSNVPGYQAQFRTLVSNAFDEWCRASNGKLSWRQVSSARQAAIVVGWTAQTRAMGGGFEAGETQTTTVRTARGWSIESARISILTSKLGRPFPREELYRTCLHEVGHALGLQGHSSTMSDIMYPSLNPRQVPYLTARDSNTIQRLYRGYREAPPTIAQNAPSDLPDGVVPFSGVSSDDEPEQLDAPPTSGYGRGPRLIPEQEPEPQYEDEEAMDSAPPANMGRGMPGGQYYPQASSPQAALLKQFALNLGQQMLRQAVLRRYGF
jgi:predicted Zn-dependent protease